MESQNGFGRTEGQSKTVDKASEVRIGLQFLVTTSAWLDLVLVYPVSGTCQGHI